MTHSGPFSSSLTGPDTAAAGHASSRASGGISDTARLAHHARRAWERSMAEFEAFERGVPEVDAQFPQHAAARRIACQRLRKRKGA